MKFFKYALLLLVVVVGLYLCTGTEQFKNIDPKNFNAELECDTLIKSPKDLVVAFDTTLAKGEKLSVTSEKEDNGQVKITAIYTIIDDDVLSGEKYVFITEHQNSLWHVLEIRYNWKCWDGYGHTDWGI